MTGCGRSQLSDGGWEVTVELRTVNHRFLDVALRLPRELGFLEQPIRSALSEQLHRGHAEVFVTVRNVTAAAREVAVDEALARAYSEAAKAIAAATGRPDTLSVAELMGLEGVLCVSEAALDEEAVTALAAAAVREAAGAVCAMRETEGAALRADLSAHLEAVAALREQLAARAPQIVESYRESLEKRLTKNRPEGVDPIRLAQEVAIMADRLAVDEELARLGSHIAQMRAYLGAEGEIGKKMDFLIQEMNREVNTIGSKAQDAAAAQLVVNCKSEIEKLREQIQNVE